MPDIKFKLRKSDSSGLEFADKEGGAELQQTGEEGGAGWVAAVATHPQYLAQHATTFRHTPAQANHKAVFGIPSPHFETGNPVCRPSLWLKD